MMGDSLIGDCDCCNRQDVPRGHFNAGGRGGVETFACYICQGDTDPDPYGELEPAGAAQISVTPLGLAAMAEYERANGERV